MDRTDGYSSLSIVLYWLAAIFFVALFLTHVGSAVARRMSFT